MTTLREAAQQALEALTSRDFGWTRRFARDRAIEALEAALAEPVLNPAPGYCKHCKQYTIEEPLPAEPVQEPVQDGKCKHCVDGCPACDARKLPVQEPVAWTYEWKHRLHGGSLNVSRARWPESDLWIETPLYAAPPQRKPEPNSDYERGFVDGMSEQARRSVDKAVNAMTKCKPLAEEEIARLVTNDMVKFARAIERAHGIGGNDE